MTADSFEPLSTVLPVLALSYNFEHDSSRAYRSFSITSPISCGGYAFLPKKSCLNFVEKVLFVSMNPQELQSKYFSLLFWAHFIITRRNHSSLRAAVFCTNPPKNPLYSKLLANWWRRWIIPLLQSQIFPPSHKIMNAAHNHSCRYLRWVFSAECVNCLLIN